MIVTQNWENLDPPLEPNAQIWEAQASEHREQGILPRELSPCEWKILQVYKNVLFSHGKGWGDCFFEPARLCHLAALTIFDLPERSLLNIALKIICLLGIAMIMVPAWIIAIPGYYMQPLSATERLQTEMPLLRQNAWKQLSLNNQDILRTTIEKNLPRNTFRLEGCVSSYYRFNGQRLTPVRVITLQSANPSPIMRNAKTLTEIYDRFAAAIHYDALEKAQDLEEWLNAVLTPRDINRGDVLQLARASRLVNRVQIIVAEDFSRMEILATR